MEKILDIIIDIFKLQSKETDLFSKLNLLVFDDRAFRRILSSDVYREELYAHLFNLQKEIREVVSSDESKLRGIDSNIQAIIDFLVAIEYKNNVSESRKEAKEAFDKLKVIVYDYQKEVSIIKKVIYHNKLKISILALLLILIYICIKQ